MRWLQYKFRVTQGVDWGAMGSSASNKLLLNYYRGYNTLCFKERCVMNVQTYCEQKGVDYKILMPVTRIVEACVCLLVGSFLLTCLALSCLIVFCSRAIPSFSLHVRSHMCLCFLLAERKNIQPAWTAKHWCDCRLGPNTICRWPYKASRAFRSRRISV